MESGISSKFPAVGDGRGSHRPANIQQLESSEKIKKQKLRKRKETVLIESSYCLCSGRCTRWSFFPLLLFILLLLRLSPSHLLPTFPLFNLLPPGKLLRSATPPRRSTPGHDSLKLLHLPSSQHSSPGLLREASMRRSMPFQLSDALLAHHWKPISSYVDTRESEFPVGKRKPLETRVQSNKVFSALPEIPRSRTSTSNGMNSRTPGKPLSAICRPRIKSIGMTGHRRPRMCWPWFTTYSRRGNPGLANTFSAIA